MSNYAVTTRQERFAELISLGTLSDVEAARQAGYSAKGARASAQQNRGHPAVTSLIEEKSGVVSEHLKVTREMVLQGLLNEAQNGNTSSARTTAWTQVGRALGMFTDKVQPTREWNYVAEMERINYDIACSEGRDHLLPKRRA
jgi:phage terminase small subunit